MGNATSTSGVSETMIVMYALVFMKVLGAQNARLSNITAALTGVQYFFEGTNVEPRPDWRFARAISTLMRRIGLSQVTVTVCTLGCPT